MESNIFGYIVTPKNSMLGGADQKVSAYIRENKMYIFWQWKESPLVFIGKESKKLDSSDRVKLYGVFARINKNGAIIAAWEKIYIDWKYSRLV